MNCPMCGHKDVTRECPACGEILEQVPLELVAVKSFDSAPEAHAARACLEAEGIRAFVSGAEIVGMVSYLGNAVGYVKVEVPRNDFEAATEILRTARLHPISIDDSACLACGQPMSETETCCRACGWTFADPDAGGPFPAELSPVSEAGMQRLRNAKTVFIGLWLFPVLLALVLGAVLVVIAILKDAVQTPFGVVFILAIFVAALLLARWLTTLRNV